MTNSNVNYLQLVGEKQRRSGHTNVLSNKDKIARGAHLFLQQLNSLNVNPRCVVCEHMHW
jgi:hypothetical protein